MSQVIDLAIEEYHICFPWETLGLFCSLLFVMFLSICTAKHCLISFLAFEWVRARSIDLYTLEFTVLLLAVVTSSVNGSDGVALAAIHAYAIMLPPPYLTVGVKCLDQWRKEFTWVVFCGLSGLFVLLSLVVHSFFKRMYQIVDLVNSEAMQVQYLKLTNLLLESGSKG